MPQKRNPDAAELVRAKTGRVVGALNALLLAMKGLPLAYGKDMQEDKEPTFDAADTLSLCLAAMAGMVRDMRNRFLVSLAFTAVLFVWAPMGLPVPIPAAPFGLEHPASSIVHRALPVKAP